MRGGYVRLDGLDVHHVYGGHGSPSVVFVHGLGSAGYLEWRYTLPALARAHRVFAPDLPGFGRSEKPAGGYGIPLFARVIDEYIRTRRLKPVLVGTSMGGRVALDVALRSPELVRKLVLVNSLGVVRPAVHPFYPLLLVPRVGEGMLGLIREALHRLSPAQVRRYARRFMGVSGDVERVLDDVYLSGLREMHATDGFPRAYVSTVRALARPEAYRATPLMARLAECGLPVLLIWGAKDRLLPLARARAALEALPGARMEVIEDAGHTPQVERPEEFNRVLEDFF
ncbi:MAG TPA: alpha/beta hydrolase [Candidatus Dormibacteraeota bacterium]|nr:alpha/beta hydrolase [Candidatus Dormibacteraeota bacterium]